MNDREAFEAHMRRLNPCVHLGKQKIDDTYRTISVERNWQLWQEAIRHAVASSGPSTPSPAPKE